MNCSSLSWANNNYAVNKLTIVCDETDWQITEIILWTSVGVGSFFLISTAVTLLVGDVMIGAGLLTPGLMMLY